VRPAPASGTTSRPLSDSKLDITDSEYDTLGSKASDAENLSDRLSERKMQDDDASPVLAADARTPSGKMASVRAGGPADQAEAKDYDNEYEPDFEDDEEQPTPPRVDTYAQHAAEARISPRGGSLSASRKVSAVDLQGGARTARDNDAQEKMSGSIIRVSSMKIEFEDDKAGIPDFQGTLGPRFNGDATRDPFHTTDGSTMADPHSFTAGGTMGGDNDVWDPVWTQGRGVIRGDEPGAEDLFAKPEGIREDEEIEEEVEDAAVPGGDEEDISVSGCVVYLCGWKVEGRVACNWSF
jgi:hypothetical protein